MSETINYTREELDILKGIHKHDLKGRYLKREYPRLYRIEFGRVQGENAHELKLLCKQILRNLGYTSNRLYSDETDNIVNSISNDLAIYTGQGYTRETLAFAIVSETLEYYKASFNEMSILKDYNIESDKYMNLRIKLHEWVILNYWKPTILVS